MSAREPKCAACICGAMHTKPWQSHEQISNIWPLLNITKLAQCVLVDQMISPELGFIVQLKGGLTRARYMVITMYVVHFYMLCSTYLNECIHQQRPLSLRMLLNLFKDSMVMKYVIIIALMALLLTNVLE